MNALPMPYHPLRGNQGRLGLPPEAARDRRSAKNADRPMHQSREAHLPARPLHSPEGGSLRLLQVVADYIA
jgi:hypothetical protein